MDRFDTRDCDTNSTAAPKSPPVSKLIRVGKEKPQAPTGEHIARCVHVEPAWTFLGNRKIALYFEVCDGIHTGTTARRFYNLKKLHNGDYEIAPKSKFLKDVGKLFHDQTDKGAIDPAELFLGKFFINEVERQLSKDGGFNSIVTEICLY
ncbi:MAG: hypothetical protein VW907_05240, partial [Opitutae bacterium]